MILDTEIFVKLKSTKKIVRHWGSSNNEQLLIPQGLMRQNSFASVQNVEP
jgi:hypothetical protein